LSMRHPHLLRRWLAATLLDWVQIVAAMAAGVLAGHWAVWVLVVLVVGTRQHALALMFHEAAHWLACDDRRWNDFLGKLLTGWPLGVDSYRVFHFGHHWYLGTEHDPELLHWQVWSKGQYDPPRTRWQFARRFAMDCVGLGLGETLKVIRMIGKPELGRLVWWVAVGGALVYLGLWQVVVAWVAAMLTSFLACFRLRVWSEHVGTTGTHVVAANRLWRFLFLPHNTWCHHEHHEDPQLPFWALPAARTLPARPVGQLLKDFGDMPPRFPEKQA
jgi:fatty acid desaturase